MSAEACSLALSSSALPTSTNPSSMAGSSKKVFQPRPGSPAAMQLTPKLALAPSPTRVLMSGAPLRHALHPSTSSSRPGPVPVAADVFACDDVPAACHLTRHQSQQTCCFWCRKELSVNCACLMLSAQSICQIHRTMHNSIVCRFLAAGSSTTQQQQERQRKQIQHHELLSVCLPTRLVVWCQDGKHAQKVMHARQYMTRV